MHRKKCSAYACLAVLIAFACALNAQDTQTFQLAPDSANTGARAKGRPQPKPANSQPKSQSETLGWGSNIQNARIGRAAELALQHGDYVHACEYAERAARKAAPNDPQLWFLLLGTQRVSTLGISSRWTRTIMVCKLVRHHLMDSQGWRKLTA